MRLLQDYTQDLQEKIPVSSLYRIQGIGSFPYISINHHQLVFNCLDNYVYFSRTKSHHSYYSSKKCRFFLKELGKEAFKQEPIYNFKLTSTCEAIRQQIKLKKTFPTIYSYQIIISRYFEQLLCENAITRKKLANEDGTPELSDRARHGGAYGLKEEWLNLLSSFSAITIENKIEKDEMMSYLEMIHKRSLGILSREQLEDLLPMGKSIYAFNGALFSPYSKYGVMESLEQIIEEQKCPQESSLLKSPITSIRTIVTEYETFREQTTKELEKVFQKHL